MEWSPPSEDEATRHLHAAFPSLQFTTDEDDDADCDVDISVDDIRLPSVKDAIQQSIDGALAKWEELLPISTMEVLRVTQQRAATQKIARLVLKDEPTTDVTDQKIQGIFRDLVTEDECLAARRPYLLHDSLYLLEVMHSSLASKKSQFLLVLGSTPLTALADAIYCRDYEYLKEFGLHSKMMYMAGQFFVDKRQPHHVDYSNDVRQWLQKFPALQLDYPGLPDKIGAIRDAVKRKSVALAGMKSVTSVTSFFNRGPNSQLENSNGSPPGTSGRSDSIDYDDDEMILSPQNRVSRGTSSDRHSGSMTRVEKPTTLVGSSSYTEPPEPYLPAGGLLESATKNVQAKMIEMLDIYRDTSPCEDPSIECSVFLSRNVAQADRVVVFIGDSVGSPAGIWSSKLCVRSGSGVATTRLITGWRDHIDSSQASHAFIVCYGEGGRLLVETLRAHLPEMRRLLSGIAFIQSTHRVDSADTYLLRKTMAQWAVHYASSMEPQLSRLKHKEVLYFFYPKFGPIAKTREAREELMPDSPVNMPNSPSASRAKHFDRFSYAGGELAAEAKEVHDSASAQYEDVIEEEEEEEGEDGDGDDDGPQTPQDVTAQSQYTILPSSCTSVQQVAAVTPASLVTMNTHQVPADAAEWKVAHDPRSNRPYYYHPVTRETTWKKPAALIQKEKDAASQFFRMMEHNIKSKMMRSPTAVDESNHRSSSSSPCHDKVVPKQAVKTNRDSGRPPKTGGPPRLFRTLSAKEDMFDAMLNGIATPRTSSATASMRKDIPSPIAEEIVSPHTAYYASRQSDLGMLPTNLHQSSDEFTVPPQPQRMRSNSTNSIFVRMGTMNKPDQTSTFFCVATVLHGHILESTAAPLPMDPRFLGFQAPSSSMSFDVPSVDAIVAFMTQIYRTAQMESECIIMGLIYVERLLQAATGKGLQLTPTNWQSIVFCSMVMASKVWDDLSMCNADFSKIFHGNFPLRRINALELLYLDCVEYNVRVSAASYAKYYFHLRSIYKSLKLGHLSAFDSNTPLNLEGARKMQVISEDYEERIKLLPPPLRRRSRTISSQVPSERIVEEEYRYSDLTAPPASLEQLVHMEVKSAGGNSSPYKYTGWSKRHSE
ncbi:hypothetical protein DYB36_001800 [Aphanomyces astaci]|uniref:WW domain-containing protein n=1 Tax=Aphanomyces astaci TaxID=112090 RepID=A0A397AZX0_APHAT|nr:hypothetical protein DYB36_001800 [Aphanomyces astaci]